MFKHEASSLLGISRDDFDHELIKRGLPTHTITAEDYREDVATLEALRGRH
jgi:predicted HTH domain antitoxin